MKYSKKVVGIKKPVRTISGVTPLTVVLKPRKCNHGGCIYCAGGKDVPQSYTNKSPAIMRALALKFDAYKQVKARLKVLEIMGHPTDKIELIFIGGTFLQYSEKYQKDFVKDCFDALNLKKSKTFEQAKKLNEKAKHRCVAFCIENRPDNCSAKEIQNLLDFGVTRVEIGVQMPDDKIYKKINRGHTVEDVVLATERLKNAGFKLGYHIMPGLPESNLRKDLKMFKKLFTDSRFKPDQLKIYPCQIVQGSVLAKIYKKIKYKPYNDIQISKFLKKIMKIIPEYCRVMRVMREIPKEKMVFEPIKLELRKDVEDELRASGKKISEIRMREIGFNKGNLNLDLKLKVLKYNASNGKEFFLQIVNKDNILFGLLRLRILCSPCSQIDGSQLALPNCSHKKQLIKKTFLNNSKKFRANCNQQSKLAIIRELHVYGQALEIGKHEKGISQHSGFGKKLMKKSEEISKKEKVSELKVISGIGVRNYYKKLGYVLEGNYMVKKIN